MADAGQTVATNFRNSRQLAGIGNFSTKKIDTPAKNRSCPRPLDGMRASCDIDASESD